MPSHPRPILKTPPSPTLTATSPLPFPSSRIPVCDSPHVHFPPTPTMTQTEITHSSFTYDRKPIVVLPNTCALPERGERAIDTCADADNELGPWAQGHRKKAAKGDYFHPRAYEAVECEAIDGDHPEPSPSLLSTRDSSSLPSPYRIPNDTLYDSHCARTLSNFRPIQAVGALGASDAAGDHSMGGNFHLNGPMDACQFIQHIPHMNLSLPFLPPKQTNLRSKTHHVKECPSSPKKKSARRSQTTGSTNSLERTRKVVSNAGCWGFSSEGCLGGF